MVGTRAAWLRVLALVTSIFAVDAHGRLTYPMTRKGDAGYENAPEPFNELFVCRHPQPNAQVTRPTIEAGSVTEVQWDMSAEHVGDCALYISYDLDVPDTSARFVKIASFPDCKSQNHQRVSVMIPSALPAGDAILRWDWYATQHLPSVEWYDQCADVYISSASARTWDSFNSFPILVPPTYPADSNMGVGFYNPYNPKGAFYMTGPACVDGFINHCDLTASGTRGNTGFGGEGATGPRPSSAPPTPQEPSSPPALAPSPTAAAPLVPTASPLVPAAAPATTTAQPKGGHASSLCSASGPSCDITPGEGISSWFTKELFVEMFPNLCSSSCHGCQMLKYECLIKAAASYREFSSSSSPEDNKRELAAWLAEVSKETTGGGCGKSDELADGSCSCGENWCDGQPGGGCAAWGLCFVEEASGQYCSNNAMYPCAVGAEYHGRGPIQLSWNYNYGQFSEEFCGDKSILLEDPDRVASNPTLAWASSIWFWFTGGACLPGESCKPNCHEVFVGTKARCDGDIAANRSYGLGWVTNIINGGLECGGAGQGKCDYRVHDRVRFYKHFCNILGVNPLKEGWSEDGNLFCNQQQNYNAVPACSSSHAQPRPSPAPPTSAPPTTQPKPTASPAAPAGECVGIMPDGTPGSCTACLASNNVCYYEDKAWCDRWDENAFKWCGEKDSSLAQGLLGAAGAVLGVAMVILAFCFARRGLCGGKLPKPELECNNVVDDSIGNLALDDITSDFGAKSSELASADLKTSTARADAQDDPELGENPLEAAASWIEEHRKTTASWTERVQPEGPSWTHTVLDIFDETPENDEPALRLSGLPDLRVVI